MTVEEAIFCEKSYIGETNCIDCKYYGTDTCQSRESHRMAIEALEQTKWISVSEKSPNKNERLALLYDNGLISGGKYLGDKTYDVDFPDQNKKTRVVAWMLIQPYKGKSEEKK